MSPRDIEADVAALARLGLKGPSITELEVRQAITLGIAIFRTACLSGNSLEKRKVTALTTKFRDAGRRSAPWRPTSSRVAGRPQDGDDGNRRNRWLFDPDHKFYASEVNATLVELRYIFQALSMKSAPTVPGIAQLATWEWLTEGAIGRGDYLDPIQLVPITFKEFYENPTTVTSGHFLPLNRDGKHVPNNTFLTLKVSNDLQGDRTLDELLDILFEIVEAHRRLRGWAPKTSVPIGEGPL